MMNNWHEYFLNICEVVASRSKDPSTKVGAVIADPNSKAIVATGYNGLPRKVADLPERLERPVKYEWVLHGEVNAILNAARQGSRTEGTVLYVSPLPPCFQCSKAVINAGIKQIIFRRKGEFRSEWEADFKRSKELLAEAEIKVLCYNDETGELS